MSLCNLSGQKLKTKESNIPECSDIFKQLAFLRLILSRDLAETRIRINYAVSPVWVVQWIKKTIAEFLHITIVLINGHSTYKNKYF